MWTAETRSSIAKKQNIQDLHSRAYQIVKNNTSKILVLIAQTQNLVEIHPLTPKMKH